MSNQDIQNPPKKVAVYIRVSTEDQVERYGPDAQREAVYNLIKSKEGLDEPFIFAGKKHEYFDKDVSGTTKLEDRPDFARLKEAIELSPEGQKPFDAVAVYRIDRLARKLNILLEVIEFFEKHEIKFFSVTENIDTSTPFGKAILNIMGVIAELELETIKQRTQGGRKLAGRRGVFLGNAPSYGYTKNNEKQLEVLEEEKRNVQLIFDLFLTQKYTVGQIAKYLKEHEVLSPGVSSIKHGKRRGKVKKLNSNFHWSAPAVRRILSDELYTGKYYFNKTKKGKSLPQEEWELSEAHIPVIVDILTFEKAQKLLAQAKHTNKKVYTRPHSYLLSGLLKCDDCYDLGEDMARQHWVGHPKKIKGSGKYTYYYSCGRKNTAKYEKNCSALPLPAEEIEKYVVGVCLDLLKSPVAVFEHQKKLQSTKAEVRHLEDKRKDIFKALSGIPNRKHLISEQHEHGYITTKEMDKRMKEIGQSETRYRKELKDIDERIAESSMSEGYAKTLELFNEKYQRALLEVKKEPEEAYRVIHMLIDEIVVYSRDVTPKDKVAGRKKEGQKIPHKIHIKLKLPQDILNEIGEQKVVLTEKPSFAKKKGSSQKNISGGR